MNARQMADIMMRWPDGMAADDRKFFTALARRFPHEDPDEMHKAVRIVAFEKAEKVRQMEQDLGLSGQPRMDGQRKRFLRHGKGSHDIWRNPKTGKSVAIPTKVPSRHFANKILKEVGLDKAF